MARTPPKNIRASTPSLAKVKYGTRTKDVGAMDPNDKQGLVEMGMLDVPEGRVIGISELYLAFKMALLAKSLVERELVAYVYWRGLSEAKAGELAGVSPGKAREILRSLAMRVEMVERRIEHERLIGA